MRIRAFFVKLIAAVCFSVLTAVWTIQPLPSQAADASQLGYQQHFGNAYFFGDSLTECCWTGRYTNSGTPNWTDMLPPLIGASYTASKQTDLAVAGAAVVVSSNPTVATQLGINTGFVYQVDRFSAENIQVGSDDIAGIWIGTNDIWPSSYAATDQPPAVVGPFNKPLGTQPSVEDLTNYFTTNLRAGINHLVADGIRNIVLLSPYDVGQSAVELNATDADLATRYSIAFRDAESKLYTPGVKTYFVDVLSLLRQVQANPGAYGFTHITSADNCQANGCDSMSLAQQNTYIFNDIVHLTNGFHKLLVAEVAATINAHKTIPPPCDSAQ